MPGRVDRQDLESNSSVNANWRSGPYLQGYIIGLSSQGGNRRSLKTRDIRDEFCNKLITMNICTCTNNEFIKINKVKVTDVLADCLGVICSRRKLSKIVKYSHFVE